MRRIQRQRTKGWRMPEGAVYVGRPSRWGNPYRPETYLEWYDRDVIRRLAVEDFRNGCIRKSFVIDLPEYPSVEEIRAELGSATALVCWCRLEDDAGNRVPCHADVLIELLESVS